MVTTQTISAYYVNNARKRKLRLREITYLLETSRGTK